MTAPKTTTLRILPADEPELKLCPHGYLPGCSICWAENELYRIFNRPTLAERVLRILGGRHA